MLPEVKGLKGPFASLNEARYGIIWGAMGAARDCYEAALSYAKEREQFGRPVASFQLTQKKLADMTIEINKGTLLALHLGRMKDQGTLRPERSRWASSTTCARRSRWRARRGQSSGATG